MPEEPESVGFRCLFGVACGLAALFIRLPLEYLLGQSFPFILIFPAVTLASVRGGAVSAACTAAVSVIYVLFVRGVPLTAAGIGVSLVLFILAVSIVVLIAQVLRSAVSSMRAHERSLEETDSRLRLMVLELEHRVNNSLALTGALVNLTARHSTDLADFRDKFEPRLQSLARAQALLTQSNWQALDLEQLITEALTPFVNDTHSSVVVTPGDRFVAPVQAAVSLSLVLNELATNAVKHGALSNATGKVVVGWTVNPQAKRAVITWQERGGPPVTLREGAGFGTELFRVVGREALKIERDFDPQGVTCRITMENPPPKSAA